MRVADGEEAAGGGAGRAVAATVARARARGAHAGAASPAAACRSCPRDMTGYSRGEADFTAERYRRDVRPASIAPKDYSVPLHVDCSIEYELPDCAKPPQGVKIEPLLMIHPAHFRRLESLRRVPFVNNLPRAASPPRRRCCRPRRDERRRCTAALPYVLEPPPPQPRVLPPLPLPLPVYL